MSAVPTVLAVAESSGIPALWLAIGFGGQAIFFSRFAVQWVASERQKKSVIPNAFWWLSIAGAAITLAYWILRRDPVGIVGQLGGFFIYTRNLMLIRRARPPVAQPPVAL
jgi:lipid-A-disaccharide synthase-like uncharacterized protein